MVDYTPSSHIFCCNPADCFLLHCRLLPITLQTAGSSLLCIILKGCHYPATGCHRWPQVATGRRSSSPPTSPLALKSVLPPAQESQIAYFGCPGKPSAPQMSPKACMKHPRWAAGPQNERQGHPHQAQKLANVNTMVSQVNTNVPS